MKRQLRARLLLASTALLCVVVTPTAIGGSDGDFDHLIAVETQKFDEEISVKAAELAAKGEFPKNGPLTASAPSCATQVPTRPFLAWSDGADYTLMPGGTFENGASGWTLENEARIVTTTSRDPEGGTRSLSIPKGSKVITRSVCITPAHPTIRFFARATSTNARLRVEVLYEDLGGSVNAMPIAYLKPVTTWQPTTVVPIHVNLRAAVALSRTAAVAFRLTGEEGDGRWLLDGFYVDPYVVR